MKVALGKDTFNAFQSGLSTHREAMPTAHTQAEVVVAFPVRRGVQTRDSILETTKARRKAQGKAQTAWPVGET